MQISNAVCFPVPTARCQLIGHVGPQPPTVDPDRTCGNPIPDEGFEPLAKSSRSNSPTNEAPTPDYGDQEQCNTWGVWTPDQEFLKQLSIQWGSNPWLWIPGAIQHLRGLNPWPRVLEATLQPTVPHGDTFPHTWAQGGVPFFQTEFCFVLFDNFRLIQIYIHGIVLHDIFHTNY
jgi:hypothetical protein